MDIDIPIPLIQTGARTWTIPLTLNQRIHWREKNRRTQEIKTQVAWQIIQHMKTHKLQTQDHITTQLHYHPGDNRTRDPDNLIATSKPAVDGLKLGLLIPDDNPRHCTQLMPHIHPGRGPAKLYLRVILP